MPQAHNAHDCMDAEGRATQGAVAEERRICGNLFLFGEISGLVRIVTQIRRQPAFGLGQCHTGALRIIFHLIAIDFR